MHCGDKKGELSRELPAVIICLGGAYTCISEREAEPVAHFFYQNGYQTFILYYSVGEAAANFKPLIQLGATVSEIRKHTNEWGVIFNRIIVCGFLAGGHLAASLGVLHNNDRFLRAWNRNEDIRPDAMILGYPVITADDFAHVSSIEHVSGAKAGSKEYEWFGLNKRVDKETPPEFLWHTAADTNVPVENSLYFARALSTAKIPFELHVFPLLAQFDNTIKNTIKNAFIMSIINFGKTLIVVIFNSVPIILFLGLPHIFVANLPIWMFWGFSFIAFINVKIFVKVFDRYITGGENI